LNHLKLLKVCTKLIVSGFSKNKKMQKDYFIRGAYSNVFLATLFSLIRF